MKRFFSLSFSGIGILVLVYFSWRFFVAYKIGYSLSEMDWDDNGNTTASEILLSTDIGVRNTIVDGKQCKEYFGFKDGLTIKLKC